MSESPAEGLRRRYADFATNVCRLCAKRRAGSVAGRARLDRDEHVPLARAAGLGPFVRDQVEALRRRDDVEVELFAFGPGPRALARAARDAAPRYRGQRFDIVHAHFGLTAWPALLARLGPVVVTLARQRPARPALVPRDARARCRSRRWPPRSRASSARTCPARARRGGSRCCRSGSTCERFRPIPRAEARARLGLDPDGPYLLFPHDPSRPLKRYDRAVEAAGDVPLLTLGGVAPDEVPYWINAANAVLVPVGGGGLRARRDRGARVRRARVRHAGRHPPGRAATGSRAPTARRGIATPGARRSRPHLAAADPRVDGRARAELFSADAMAARVVEAWRDLLDERTS